MYNGNSQNLTVYVINTGFRLYINVTCEYFSNQKSKKKIYETFPDDIEKSRTNIEFHYTQKGDAAIKKIHVRIPNRLFSFHQKNAFQARVFHVNVTNVVIAKKKKVYAMNL